MRKIWVLVAVVAVLLLGGAVAYFLTQEAEVASGTKLVLGAPAPVFEGVDTSGTKHSLADYKGKIVVLEWTNHECPYVAKHYNAGAMQSLQNQAKVDDIVWLRVISSAPGEQGHLPGDKIDEISVSHGAEAAATLMDETGVIGRMYGAKTTPHMFIIDAQGVLVYAGGIDDRPSTELSSIVGATPYVSLALSDLLAGNSVGIPQSRAYGCSVKYK